MSDFTALFGKNDPLGGGPEQTRFRGFNNLFLDEPEPEFNGSAAGLWMRRKQEARQEFSDRQLLGSLESAMRTNPEIRADALRLGLDPTVQDQAGLQEMLPKARAVEMLRQMRRRKMAESSPILWRELYDPEFAGLAHDDLDNLSWFETFSRGWNIGALSVDRGKIAVSIMDKLEHKLPVTEADWSRLREIDRRIEASPMGESWMAYTGQTLGQMWYTSAPAMLVGGAAGIATSFFPGGQAAAPWVFLAITTGAGARSTYQVEAGNAFADYLDQHMDVQEALTRANLVGMVNAGIEVVPLGLFAKPFAGAGKNVLRRLLSKRTVGRELGRLAKNYALSYGSEIGAEIAQDSFNAIQQRLGQHATRLLRDRLGEGDASTMLAAEGLEGQRIQTRADGSIVVDPALFNYLREHTGVRATAPVVMEGEVADKFLRDFRRNFELEQVLSDDEFLKDLAKLAWETASGAAKGMWLPAAIGPLAEHATARKKVQQARINADALRGASDRVKQSQTAKRSQTVFSRFWQRASAGQPAENVYIDRDELASVLEEAGTSVDELVEILPGLKEQLAQDRETHPDIELKTADVLTALADTDLLDVMTQVMRPDESAPSLRQAEELAEQLDEEAKSLRETVDLSDEEIQVRDAKLDNIERDFRAKAEAAGMLPGEAAAAAAFVRNYVMAQAHNRNVDVDAIQLPGITDDPSSAAKLRSRAPVLPDAVAGDVTEQQAQEGATFDNNPNPEAVVAGVRVRALRPGVFQFRDDRGLDGSFSQLEDGSIVMDSAYTQPEGSGQGLYRQLLKRLADTFGAVHSSATLSESAVRAWESVGAVRSPDGQTFTLRGSKPLRQTEDELQSQDGDDTRAVDGDQANEGSVPDGRGVRRSGDQVDEPSGPLPNATPLDGLPTRVVVDGVEREFGPDAEARQVAEAYAREHGIDYAPPTKYVEVDPERARRIADAYEEAVHAPNDPEVRAAYEALARETIAQFEAMLRAGIQVEFMPESGDPYGNPRNALFDLRDNKHIYIFSTEDGYGQTGITDKDRAENPMLRDSGYKFGDRPALINDLFRAVHDYFGHFKEGVGFRARGEENAWQQHMAMFSPLARHALTTETRGQNSWVNFGPHAEHNRTASPADTIYADQKLTLLPKWVHREGYEGGRGVHRLTEEERRYLKYEPQKNSKGEYPGAPEWVKDRKDVVKMRKLLRKLTKEGLVGRYWYEKSAQAVLKIVNYNIRDAERFLQLLAIYSPNSNLWTNMINAVRAYTHWKQGRPAEELHAGLGSADEKARALLYEGKEWAGRKTNSFYLNLMHYVYENHRDEVLAIGLDPSVIEKFATPVTIDVWMYRAFGYLREQGRDDKLRGRYTFAENELRRIAAELNAKLLPGEEKWTPHQVQAAIWTGMKTRYELPDVKAKTNKLSKSQGLITKDSNGKPVFGKTVDERIQHQQNWRRVALQVPSARVIAAAQQSARDFADDLFRMTGHVTWEAVPTAKIPHPIHQAPLEVVEEFTREARQLLLDEDGNDELAMRVGVSLVTSQQSHGAYAGGIAPNVITTLTPARPVGARGEVTPLAPIRAYARAIQQIYKQDAVPFFRPENSALTSKTSVGDQMFKVVNEESGKTVRKFESQAEAEAYADSKNRAAAKKSTSDGDARYTVRGGNLARAVTIVFDHDLTLRQEEELLALLGQQVHEEAGFTKTASNEIMVVNFRDDNTKLPFMMRDEEFITRTDAFIENIKETHGIQESGNIWVEGEYGPTVDWSRADREAAGSQESEDAAGGPSDLQAWIRDRSQAFEELLQRYDEAGIREAQRAIEERGRLRASDGEVVRGEFAVNSLAIILHKAHNASTFFHEFAHFHLEVLTRRYLEGSATEQEIADLRTIAEWAGYESLDEFATAPIDARRKGHEAFAYSFERYLYRNEAPANMRSVLRRFSDLVVSVYRGVIRRINANYKRETGEDLPAMTEEVRAVMDRMLFVHEQVELRAEQESLHRMLSGQELTEQDAEVVNDLIGEADAEAKEKLRTLMMRQLRRLRTFRSRELRRLQRESRETRARIEREEADALLAESNIARLHHWLETGEFIELDAEGAPVRRKPELDAARIATDDPRVPPRYRHVNRETAQRQLDEAQNELAKAKQRREEDVSAIEAAIEEARQRIQQAQQELSDYRRERSEDLKAMRAELRIVRKAGNRELESELRDRIRETESRRDERVRSLYSEIAKLRDDIALGESEISDLESDVRSAERTVSRAEAFLDRMSDPAREADGLDPEFVAELFGFDSVDQMFNALLVNMEEAKNRRADARMAMEYPDLSDDETIEAIVDDAVNNEALLRLRATEARIMDKRLPSQSKIVAAARAVAEKVVASMPVAELFDRRPGEQTPRKRPLGAGRHFALQAAKAEAEARRARNAGDLETMRSKQRLAIQMRALSHEAYAKKELIKKKVDSLHRRLRYTGGKREKQLAKNYNGAVIETAREILRHLFHNSRFSDSVGRGSRHNVDGDYVPYSELNPESPLRTELELALSEAETFGARVGGDAFVASTNDLTNMLFGVEGLLTAGRRAQQVRRGEIKQTIEELVEELTRQAEEQGLPVQPLQQPRSDLPRKVESFSATWQRMESLLYAMDGNRQGALTQVVWQPVVDAVIAMREQETEVMNDLNAALQPIKDAIRRDRKLQRPIQAEHLIDPRTNKPYVFQRGKIGIVGALLHSGNDSNLRRLIGGYGWGEVDPNMPEFDRSAWDRQVAAWEADGTITREDWQVVQDIWSIYDKLLPQTRRAHFEILGFEMDVVQRGTVKTRWGEIKGGYVPAARDPALRSARTSDREIDQQLEWQRSLPAVYSGHTKQRVEGRYEPLDIDPTRSILHFHKSLVYSHMGPVLKQLQTIVANDDVRAAIERLQPGFHDNFMRPWLQTVATQSTTLGESYDPMGAWSLFTSLRRSAGTAAMLANVKNALQNISGIALAVARVKPRYLLQAVWELASGYRATRDAITEKSAYMRDRFAAGNNIYEIRDRIYDLMESHNAIIRSVQSAQKFLARHTYFLQEITQKPIDRVVWIGAYKQSLDAGMSESQAVHAADGAVRMTQGDNLAISLATGEKGSEVAKLFSQFMSWFVMLGSLRASVRGQKPWAALGALVLGPALTTMVLGEIIGEMFEDRPDDEEWDATATRIAFTSVAALPRAFGLPGAVVSTAMQSTIGAALGTAESFQARMPEPPAFSVIMRALRETRELLDGDEISGADVADAVEALSVLLGVPITPVSRRLRRGLGVLSEEEADPAALLTGR